MGHLGGFAYGGRTNALGEPEDTEDPPDVGGAFTGLDGGAHGVQMRAGMAGAVQEGERRWWRARRAIAVIDAVPAALLPHVLAQELAGREHEVPDVELGPAHLDALPDPARRYRVVGGLDLDAAVEMHGAQAVALVAKRLEWWRLERRLPLGKHRGDLPLRRSMDARVDPMRFPSIEIGLRRLERTKHCPRKGVCCACPTLDPTFPLRSGSRVRLGTARRRRRTARALRDRSD